jgi:hypothetical protein
VFTVSYPGGEETLTKARTEANLVDALKWVDQNAVAGTAEAYSEYLVRLEKDEAIIKMNLLCMSTSYTTADYVRIRLRGAGAERKISHDETTTVYTYPSEVANSMTNNTGLLNVGWEGVSGQPEFDSIIDLQIEDKVTLDGKNEKFNNNAALDLRGMVQVSRNCRFIMEEGSKITGFVAKGETVFFTPVVVRNYGAFYMRGGEISNTTLAGTGGAIVVLYPSGVPGDSGGDIDKYYPMTVKKTGGVFKNTRYNGSPNPSYIYWANLGLAGGKITVAENDSETQIVFTTLREFQDLRD